jgi:TonB family protein
MVSPVSCAQFEDLAVLYALGELQTADRAAVEEHVRQCQNCAAVLQREVSLAALLCPANRPTGEEEPIEILLAQCRSELARTLDQDETEARPRAWAGLFSWRQWMASLRLSPRFHPAWSVAALAAVAAVSGFAGWEGIGHTPLQIFGPAVITVSATPPPPVTSAAPAAAPQAPAVNPPVMPKVSASDRVYAASEAGMNNAFSRDMFDAAAAQDRQQQLSRTWRHAPPLRMPRSLSAVTAFDAPPSGSLDEISRTMEAFWWGGIRINPSEQQKRLVMAPLPEYPEVARRAGIEGEVTLLVRIGKNGSVQDAQMLSGEPVLGRAATEAVEQWRYSPLRIGGQPVSVLTSVTLAFQFR